MKEFFQSFEGQATIFGFLLSSIGYLIILLFKRRKQIYDAINELQDNKLDNKVFEKFKKEHYQSKKEIWTEIRNEQKQMAEKIGFLKGKSENPRKSGD